MPPGCKKWSRIERRKRRAFLRRKGMAKRREKKRGSQKKNSGNPEKIIYRNVEKKLLITVYPVRLRKKFDNAFNESNFMGYPGMPGLSITIQKGLIRGKCVAAGHP